LILVQTTYEETCITFLSLNDKTRGFGFDAKFIFL